MAAHLSSLVHGLNEGSVLLKKVRGSLKSQPSVPIKELSNKVKYFIYCLEINLEILNDKVKHIQTMSLRS